MKSVLVDPILLTYNIRCVLCRKCKRLEQRCVWGVFSGLYKGKGEKWVVRVGGLGEGKEL